MDIPGMEELPVKVGKLEAIVLGNGSAGLTQRVQDLEDRKECPFIQWHMKQEKKKKFRAADVANWLSFAGIVIAIILGYFNQS